jgi:uncharacterized protein YlxW (UPF0749 family)
MPDTPPAPVHRLDDSMSLLNDLGAHALDPGYAEAAARRPVASAPAERIRPAPVTVVVMLALLGLLLAAAVGQLRDRRPAVARLSADLRAQVRTLESQVETLDDAVSRLRTETAALRGDVLDRASAQELEALEAITGSRPVRGPGLRVTIDDAPSDKADPITGEAPEEGRELGRVLDRDLQHVVNALWAAGAEAVSINGRRLTTTSAVRAAGAAILVDYRPISPPYVVEAIGDPRTLEADFADSAAVRGIETLASATGIRFDVSGVRELELPAAPGLSLRYAVPGARS